MKRIGVAALTIAGVIALGRRATHRWGARPDEHDAARPGAASFATASRTRWDRRTCARLADDVRNIDHADPRVASCPVTEGDLEPLPEPAQRYLRRMGVVGRPRDRSFTTLGLVTVADGEGPEFDASELVTYVNDAAMIAPSMLLTPSCAWTPVDSTLQFDTGQLEQTVGA